MKNYDAYSDEELLEMLRNGESSVAEYLMEKYKPLVRKRARALYLAGGDHEDLLQEGMLGLYKAVREYQPEREGFFSDLCGTLYFPADVFRGAFCAAEKASSAEYVDFPE